ncbi:uncharacterized protein LOC122319690 [Drosophila yakuba]|uniref:uncharacterized protein LOC122319690 n=1 Tax=Drosophila yakuba TaxID=7245 RepID=UPI001C8A1E94|nr:uncharacterized protein LOC122319690 [Drosophila yakuba]
MSIPRLELQVAVLGTRLMNTIKEEHSVVISDLVLWMDSKTVLRWIGSTHRRYKQFCWQPSGGDSGFVEGFSVEMEILELQSPGEDHSLGLTVCAPVPKQKGDLEEYGLTAAECEVVENLLVRQAQLESFPDEIRIDAALCMPYSARRPIILSHRHSLTDLIVRHFHARMMHQNVDVTIAEIRTSFCVTRMRRVMRSVIASRNKCKLQRARPMPPIMGPHPVDRLDAGGWPFKHTGLDYFAPRLVTVSRHKEKRWVALFTCLTTKAIHLELAHDLSTDSCIIAIRNFVCRRGPVHRLRSDIGKNFVGADREARRFGDVFEMEKFQINPSEGGVWERMVQCVKRVLRHTLKEVVPRDHVLESFLIEAENIVNSRPLTHLPVDADQEASLTPNDLLKGVANLPDTPGLDAELPNEKWCRRTEPIHQGDLVFVCNPALPRRELCKGIVEEVYSGADGVIRRAKVSVNDNGQSRTMMRPVFAWYCR